MSKIGLIVTVVAFLILAVVGYLMPRLGTVRVDERVA